MANDDATKTMLTEFSSTVDDIDAFEGKAEVLCSMVNRAAKKIEEAKFRLNLPEIDVAPLPEMSAVMELLEKCQQEVGQEEFKLCKGPGASPADNK